MKRFAILFVLLVTSISFAGTYSGGNGEPNTPYQIATVSDWQQLMNTSSHWEKNFIMTADVDLSGITLKPVGNSNARFTGTFDGNDYIISNAVINTPDRKYVGLFGMVSGRIENLGVENVNITGSDYVGGLAGLNIGGTIIYCHATGSVSGTGNEVGGLIGRNNGGGVGYSYAIGTVSGKMWVGGFVGLNVADGEALSCYAACIVSGSKLVGGFVGANGENSAASNASIIMCYATGTVRGSGNWVGGFVGNNCSEGSLHSCYATGTVRGVLCVGGLAGWNSGQISGCYSVSKTSGKSFVGGLCGVSAGEFIAGFWDVQTSGKIIGVGYGSSAGVMGRTTAKMKTRSTFITAGWDFVNETANGTENIWTIRSGVTYPKLFSLANTNDLGSLLAITKCTVIAGRKITSDKIFLSGILSVSDNDFNDANSIIVTIDSNDIVVPCGIYFPKSSQDIKNGIYHYSGIENGIRKSFTYNQSTGKFSFAAGGLDLSGLGCPVNVGIEIGDFNTAVDIDETIVNGTKRPMPIRLMFGVRDVLRVDKCTIKQNDKNSDGDQLIVKGGFAVKDLAPNMLSEDLVITLGAQQFTIPADKLKFEKMNLTCSKAEVAEGGIATAAFNFDSCSFTLTINNANIDAISGDVDFGVAFAGFDQVDSVTLP